MLENNINKMIAYVCAKKFSARKELIKIFNQEGHNVTKEEIDLLISKAGMISETSTASVFVVLDKMIDLAPYNSPKELIEREIFFYRKI